MDLTNAFAFTSAAGPIPETTPLATDRGGKPASASDALSSAPTPVKPSEPKRTIHRLHEVRRREGLTRQKVAQRLGISVSEVEKQELPSSDILLSELHRWQKALNVPVAELLNEPNGELSSPVLLRTRLLRAMKTVRSIEAGARQVSIRRLAAMLAEQFVEIMPELKDTVGWAALGSRPSEIEAFDWHLPFQKKWT